MRKDLSRITVDIPTKIHKKFKAFAANKGKSMRELIEHSISILMTSEENEECPNSHIPNKKTIKAIKDSRSKKNMVKSKNAEDLFKKLGI